MSLFLISKGLICSRRFSKSRFSGLMCSLFFIVLRLGSWRWYRRVCNMWAMMSSALWPHPSISALCCRRRMWPCSPWQAECCPMIPVWRRGPRWWCGFRHSSRGLWPGGTWIFYARWWHWVLAEAMCRLCLPETVRSPLPWFRWRMMARMWCRLRR